MRIAYFSDNFYPEISGISDSIITTGIELTKRGHKVAYIAPWYPASAYKSSRNPEWDKLNIFRLPSMTMFNSPTGQSRIAFPVGASIPFLKKFKPDVLHVQSPYGCGLEAILASKLLGVPLVGTNHTPLEEFIHYLPGGRYYIAPALAYETWFYNRCMFVTAPYQGLIDTMRKRGFKRAGRGQANPVPFINPKSLSEEEKRACKVQYDVPGPLVLSSGRLAPEKHVNVMLRAFKVVLEKVSNATLVVTGHGSHEQLLKSYAKTLGIDGHVRFVGFVTPDKLADFYCTAETYVVMSTAETQSLSLMQAFANGVPAVAARSRGLVDYCPPECGFLVEPGDEEALAKYVVELLTDRVLRDKLGSAGVAFVTKFTPEPIAQQWEDIYASALRAPSSRGAWL